MNPFARDETRPGRPLVYVGLIAYALASAAFLVTGNAAGGALLWIPLLLAMAALVLAPFVLLTSMLWGMMPIDFTYVKWALRRHYRWIVGVAALSSVALALAVAASS